MLTDRQLNILSLIIQYYTTTGNPVGSKTLMKEGIQASSATIRNDMMSLEDKGLIEKTHSSSGRIPSLVGYRFYVDHLLRPVKVSNKDLSLIRQSFGRKFYAINDIVKQSSKILSQLTTYTAFSLGPEVKERKLTGFRIVPLNEHQIMAIIVTDRGNVESQVFGVPNNISSEDLEKMIKIINDKLVGQPLLTVYHKLRTEIPLLLHKYFQTPDGIMNLFESVMSHAFEDKVFVSGKMNVLDYAAVKNLNEFKSVYSLINDQEEITSLLSSQKSDIDIRIGSELGHSLLENMSMITATYDVKGHGKGIVALLGPTNMPYSKMFSLLDVFRKELATQLIEYYRSLDSPKTS